MKDLRMVRATHLPNLRTIGLTVAAMTAFSANSVLCRLALAQGSIDPASFTFVRIGSGLVVLWLVLVSRGKRHSVHGSWWGSLALFGYAATFSYAYVSLPAGTGALLLFGAVQTAMVATGLVQGERLAPTQWLGFALAVTGLGTLLAPGVSAPPTGGAALMLAAGVAWGIYSLLGREALDPLGETAGNFLFAVPMASALFAFAMIHDLKASWPGILLAALSGGAASGLGYTIWYSALPGLSATQGASVQLSVPVITSIAGALFLGEIITFQLTASSLAILGGITFVVATRQNLARSPLPRKCRSQTSDGRE
jgi:drug/metabolite transporter (DMT)-like permease